MLCFCFVCLLLVSPMLLVSLDCHFLIAPSVFSNVYFLIFNMAGPLTSKTEIYIEISAR